MLAVDPQSNWMPIQYPTGTGMAVVPQSTHLPPPPPISGDGGIIQNLKPASYSAQSQLSNMTAQMNVTQQNVSGSGSGTNNKSPQEQRVKRPMNAFMVRLRCYTDIYTKVT